MLDIRLVTNQTDLIDQSIKARGLDVSTTPTIECYQTFVNQKKQLDELREKSNRIAKSIPSCPQDQKSELIQLGKETKQAILLLEKSVQELSTQYLDLAYQLPNMLAPNTPTGYDDADNLVIKTVGQPATFDFKVKDHLELSKIHDLIDFETAANITGSKFYLLKNQAVILDMALQRFAIDHAIQAGFVPIVTPDLAKNTVLTSAGFNPRGNESNIYQLKDHDLSLIATAEIPLGGIHANQILKEDKLPIRYVGVSHCFRTEAGAAGQSSKGLYRVHQFSKVELYVFCHPDDSEQQHESILELEESLYQALELPYRVMRICAGDLGAPAYKKYDIEAWMPGKGPQGDWGEVTSASNCTDFQARRLQCRFKNKLGKNAFVHTLNGTAVATSRTILALLENGQQSDGSIVLPKALHAYTGFKSIKQ
ncbi:MAG: serine--tRNA ligase [Legionellales bacterium]|nr:serine--tRNA ligase [Legionellales bacterium]|tara:strand:+ start:3268 stop:4539 length:1272 start_codon:yes stop_codon:yes gene_type:complete